MSEKRKPVLAVDVDEVLAYFIPALAEFHNDAYPGLDLTADSFHSYDFCKVWGGTVEDSYQKMDEFYESHHFQQNLQPIPHAIDVLRELKEDYELHVVTSRQFAIQDMTLDWISRHYPDIFTEIHFGNHYSRSGKVRSKPEICQDIGAVLLIDDSLQYAYQCHVSNIPAILFGEYAWNQKESVHSNLFNDGDVDIHRFDKDKHSPNIEHDMQLSPTLFRVHDWRHMRHAIDYVLHRHSCISSDTTFEVADKLKVAAIQMCSLNNKVINLKNIHRLVRRAVSTGPGVQMVCLPECCVFMGCGGDETVQAAEPILREKSFPEAKCLLDYHASPPVDYDGRSDINCVAALCEIALSSHVWLSVGGFPERTGDSGVSNTHFIISPEGKIASSLYRKMHLFDAPLVGLRESRTTVHGNELVHANVAEWSMGLSVCYDVRFPGLYQALRWPKTDKCKGTGERGAEVLLVPSAFTPKTGEPHWEVLLRARAIETQCYVIAAAQSGKHNEKRTSHGHSMIIDPWGNILGELKNEEEGVVYASLDRLLLEEIRKNMPVQDHRRTDIY